MGNSLRKTRRKTDLRTHRAEIRDNVRSHQMNRPIENIPIRTQESSNNELVSNIERHIEDTTRLHQVLENKTHLVATYMEELADRIGEDVEAHKRDYDAQKAEILQQQQQVDEAFKTASCHSPTLGNIPDQRLFQFMLILTKPAAVPLIFIHMFLRINEKKSHLKRLTILLNIPVQLRRDLLDQLTEPTISLIAQTGHC